MSAWHMNNLLMDINYIDFLEDYDQQFLSFSCFETYLKKAEVDWNILNLFQSKRREYLPSFLLKF